jgi:hypothetical protein
MPWPSYNLKQKSKIQRLKFLKLSQHVKRNVFIRSTDNIVRFYHYICIYVIYMSMAINAVYISSKELLGFFLFDVTLDEFVLYMLYILQSCGEGEQKQEILS